jgi:hypothetical protein
VDHPAPEAGIDLYWLPLGAGGWFVRLNGRVWEAVHALLERRRPLDLYHSALEVRLGGERFVVENSWPIPDAAGRSRGVVAEGPVASRRLARLRTFRYEVRRWRDGVIPDLAAAVASPQSLSGDPLQARRLLDLVASLPTPAWGRDELATGEMWNSNSVISWLLTRTGLPTDAIHPPPGGRAPGWHAGMVTARRQRAGGWGRSAPEVGEDGGGVAVGLDVVPGALDPAVLVEEEGGAQDADRGAAVAGLLSPGAHASMTAWSASVRRGKRRPYLLRKRWWLAASSGETPITGTPAAWKPARLSLNWQASLVHTVSSSPLTVWLPVVLSQQLRRGSGRRRG